MPAYSKQLEDKDGNTLYPITTAGSVVDEDGVDLQTRVENAAYIGTGSVGTLSPWVDTSDIVDGAVTRDKIDLSTLNPFTIESGTAATEVKLEAVRTDTNTSVWVGVGTSGINHGLYSGTQSKWMVVTGSDGKCRLNGDAFFNSGDTFKVTNMILTGWNSSEGTAATLRLVVPKSMAGITSVSVSGPTGSSSIIYGIKATVTSLYRISSWGTPSKTNDYEISLPITLNSSIAAYHIILAYLSGDLTLTFT